MLLLLRRACLGRLYAEEDMYNLNGVVDNAGVGTEAGGCEENYGLAAGESTEPPSIQGPVCGRGQARSWSE